MTRLATPFTVWPTYFGALALGLAAAGTLEAQRHAGGLVPVSATETLTPDTREAEFDRLAGDVAALEPQLGIFKRVARLVTPSVVHIQARPILEYRSRSEEHEAGSGVVVAFRGQPFVLTNRHVIRRSSAPHIEVRLAGGQLLTPDRVWSDRQTDIAVLAFEEEGLPSGELTPAKLGDSRRLEIGEQVLAFGSPFGLSQSVTRGIVSAKGRYNLDLGDGDVEFQNFLQTDAAINPGNSGGPLVNLRGEVIGINTAIASSSGGNEGIGFSIPIDLATRIAAQLIERGGTTRGYLGVKWDDQFRAKGARVVEVFDGSPADLASLRTNDILVSYDQIRVEDGDHLYNLVNLTEAGRGVVVELLRDGVRMRTTILIGTKLDE